MSVSAYGVFAADKAFEPMQIERRALGPQDVQIEIIYCGLCHTDVHFVRHMPATRFPCIPGHEIVGRVSAIGDKVDRHRVGDIVGVGCMVDSCRTCDACQAGEEQFCENGNTQTYNSPTADPPGYTLGGYCERIVVDQHFVLRISHPEGDMAGVAPLLCAGITSYSALKHWRAGPGKRVGIVGIGGLGHVAIRIARALGAEVVAFTTSAAKRADTMRLGAHDVVISRDPDQMKARSESLDLIVNTISAGHRLDDYLALLRRDSSMVMVGVPSAPHDPVDPRVLFRRRRSLTGSLIGGIAQTQDMLDFCARNEIVAEVEIIGAKQIDDAYLRMVRGDVRYRFVLDAATLRG